MFSRIALAAALTLVAPSSFALAQQQTKEAPAVTLKVGMPAPPLAIEKWVKGSPVASFEKGKVYVVEFWATWCGPCIRGMPHLSALQAEYASKGVTIIGVSSTDPRNSLDKVEKMVADKGDGMAYTVAWDTERTTNTAYMKAAGQGGIPCCFVVDGTGTIAYIGHPQFLDEPLAEIFAGTWNGAEDAATLVADSEQYWGFAQLARTDAKGAIEKLSKFASAHPHLSKIVAPMHYAALFAAGEYDAAYKLGAEVVDAAIAAKNSQDLNQIAWQIVDPDAKVEKRNIELALRAAEAAVKISDSKDAAILDTLARCYAWKSDFKRAIELETKAVELATEPMKSDLVKALAEYKAKLAQ